MENSKEIYGWNMIETSDLWVTNPALNHLSYLVLSWWRSLYSHFLSCGGESEPTLPWIPCNQGSCPIFTRCNFRQRQAGREFRDKLGSFFLFVDRLSILTLNDLKDQIVEVMQHSPTPKVSLHQVSCFLFVLVPFVSFNLIIIKNETHTLKKVTSSLVLLN